MANIIEIVGGTATLYDLVDERVQRTKLTVAQLVERLVKDNMVTAEITETPVLPDRTRYYLKRDARQLIIVEDQPQVRTIRWGDKQFQLAFPYVFYFIYFENGTMPPYTSRIFWSNMPMASKETELFIPNVTHVVGVGGEVRDGEAAPGVPPGRPICTMCNRVARGVQGIAPDDFAAMAAAAIDNFWESSFTPPAGWGAAGEPGEWAAGSTRHGKLVEHFKTPAAWQKASQKDPLFVLEVPWLSSKLTVGKVMNEMLDPARAVNLRTLRMENIANLMMARPAAAGPGNGQPQAAAQAQVAV